MNSLKPLVVLVIVGGIAYTVYTRLHRGSDVATPPGVDKNFNQLDVQIGSDVGPRQGGASGTSGSPGTSSSTSAAPMPTPWSPAIPATGSGPIPATGPVPGTPTTSVGAEASLQNQPNTSAPLGASPAPGSSLPTLDASPRGDVTLPASYPTTVAPTNPSAGGAPGAAAAASAGGSREFAAVLEAARRQLDAGRLVEAHRELSKWYGRPELSLPEQKELSDLLDQVGGTVIYSTQHLLEPPHEVLTGEQLENIAQRYNVSWELLGKINGVKDPLSLRPGERMKVVRGPFDAVVSVSRRQLTLLLDGMYAGRFQIGIGREYPPVAGQYTVTSKVANPVYHGAQRTIQAGDPGNPLGARWIDLGSQLAIHGTNDPANIDRTDLPGCISLGARDIDDVYDILTVGSRVVIER